jgi:DNA-binding transcriptional MerR regulator
MIKPSEKKAKRDYYNHSAVLEITGISKDRLQYFIRLGLVIPAVPCFGRGKGHKFNTVNLTRIALLNELDLLGLDAETINKIITKAPPNTIGTIHDVDEEDDVDGEDDSPKPIFCILAIFRSEQALKIRWFYTAADAYKYFYGNKKSPSSKEREGGQQLSTHSVILIETKRLWLGTELRALDWHFSKLEKTIERKMKAGRFIDPAVVQSLKRQREIIKLQLQGKFKEAKNVSNQILQELTRGIE